ncbi:MAG: hypothetical protein WA996_07840 [Candidatus Promineifilaceae bacterium]
MKRYVISILGLLVFFALALQTATAKSPTSDEGMHLLRGRVLWETGELALQGEHTPLSHWLIGIFLATESSVPDVVSLPSWSTKSAAGLVREFMWQSGADVPRLLFLGRLPIIFVGLLIGALLAHWSTRKTGLWGQAMVMTLFAFSPNLLAFSSLATTDLVATAGFLVSVLSLWAFWQQPSFLRWLIAAVALGLALGSKLTGVILLPTTLVLCYTHWRGRPWWQPGLVWLGMLPIAGIVLWALYGFEIGPIEGLPFVIPAPTYAANLTAVYDHMDIGQYAYLLGERSTEGWWQYFGVAFIVKTPAVTIILLFISLIFLASRKAWRETIYLWLPAMALFVAASYSRFNIGYRHILPIVPLVWLIAAESAPWWRHRRFLQALLLVLLVTYGVVSLLQAPHYLAYFNEFVGGSAQGYRILGDSNVDWGQDLNLLAQYTARGEDMPFFVSYAGAADPGYYGLEEPPLFDEDGNPLDFSPANPSPGRYAISVSQLQGASDIEPDIFDWFRRQDPVDNIGYSVLVYDVDSPDHGDWVAHCIDPQPALDEAMANRYVGHDVRRHVYFDCWSSWVVPSGNEPGWYIVPQDFDPGNIDEVLASDLRLVFSNRYSAATMPYKIYFLPSPPGMANRILDRSTKITTGSGKLLNPPVHVGDVASFQGGWVDETFWATVFQVEDTADEPLSVLFHLHTADQNVVVADGLGYPVNQWRPGDLFIQYHDYMGVSGQYLETGLYNYSTGDRLEIQTIDGAVSSVRLSPP